MNFLQSLPLCKLQNRLTNKLKSPEEDWLWAKASDMQSAQPWETAASGTGGSHYYTWGRHRFCKSNTHRKPVVAQVGHTVWVAQLSEDPDQGATCSSSLHTFISHHLRPLIVCLPAHCCSPTIPHTPFGGETLYFRLVLSQSPVFVPGKHEQGQEQTESKKDVIVCLTARLRKGRDCGDGRPVSKQGFLLLNAMTNLWYLLDECDGIWTTSGMTLLLFG